MYHNDKEWEESYHTQVISILTSLMPLLAKIKIATPEDDKKRATDFAVEVDRGTVAVRLRRSNCTFRDLTIRSYRENGMKTELAKIKEGYAYRYFYAWTDEHHVIKEWILVDLDRVRDLGLLDTVGPSIPNTDNETHFIAISIRQLEESGCLLASQLEKKARQVNLNPPKEIGQKLAEIRQYHNPKPNYSKYRDY